MPDSTEEPHPAEAAEAGRPHVVLGAGGHSQIVVSVLLEQDRHVVGLLDDDPRRHGARVMDREVLGPSALLEEHPEWMAVVAIGNNEARKKMVERFPEARWTTVVDERAYLNPSATVGAGSVVLPFAFLGAGVRVGRHGIVSANVTLGHDTALGDYGHVAPGAQVAGAARVGEGALLGIGSTVAPGVEVGAWSTLGVGAVAARDIPEGGLALGVPARRVAESGKGDLAS